MRGWSDSGAVGCVEGPVRLTAPAGESSYVQAVIDAASYVQGLPGGNPRYAQCSWCGVPYDHDGGFEAHMAEHLPDYFTPLPNPR